MAHRPSRRAVLAGGVVGVAAVAAGVPLARHEVGERRKHVTRMLAAPPFYVAHRGGSADWPEFTDHAYRRSSALGADALEISLARSSDGVLFGLHDDTLDRTSGTTGFTAARHPWAEISRYAVNPTGAHAAGQIPRPYLRFDEFLARFTGTRPILVDPKKLEEQDQKRILDLMDAADDHPRECFVAKGYATTTAWAQLARARGYRTWGYYYGAQIAAGTTPPARTQAAWDLLGLDVEAAPAQWDAVRAFGKPIIAHVVGDVRAARTARERHADGLMVSAVREVLAEL